MQLRAIDAIFGRAVLPRRRAPRQRRTGASAHCPPFFSIASLKEEQRYLILGYKVGMFEGVVHEDDEFAHDGGEGDLGGFAGGAQPLVKLLELTVGTGGDERGHVKGTPDRRASATDAAASVPLATF